MLRGLGIINNLNTELLALFRKLKKNSITPNIDRVIKTEGLITWQEEQGEIFNGYFNNWCHKDIMEPKYLTTLLGCFYTGNLIFIYFESCDILELDYCSNCSKIVYEKWKCSFGSIEYMDNPDYRFEDFIQVLWFVEMDVDVEMEVDVELVSP